MQGFPSYLGLPVNDPILNHATGLTRYWALRYLARLPTRCAESGSLTLCAVHFLSLPSDPAVTSNALAIRIDFPLVGATSVSFNRPGLPATLGKLEKRPRISWGVLCLLLSARVPVEGTFDGSRDLSNPNISFFQFDVVFPKWSGGSETSI